MRNAVGSSDRYRKSTKQHIEKMQRLLIEAVEQGAIGLSLGLEYAPGVDMDEVLELCSAVQGRTILLSAHYRKDAKHSISSLQELINISKLSGFPMLVSHLGSCSAFGMITESLTLLQNARDQGLDISADCYPYAAFSAFLGSAVFDPGCFELWNKSYDSILLTEAPYVGLRCDEALFYRVRQEQPDMLVVAFVMNEEEVAEALKAPFVMIASDGLFRNGQGHPRGAGTFPRVLGHYVRERRALSLLDALKKVTIMPAQRLGLANKGQIKEGFDADIVIFREDDILDF
ncbi:MAG: amidohydrolase family protein, partial [Bacillota bacterium]|nr:amidohydrolase family protein [Bacillota bacterium]